MGHCAALHSDKTIPSLHVMAKRTALRVAPKLQPTYSRPPNYNSHRRVSRDGFWSPPPMINFKVDDAMWLTLCAS